MINLVVNQPRPATKRFSKRKTILLVIFFVLVGGLSAAAYFWLAPKPVNFTGERVELAIAAPTEVVSGAEYEYKIEYKNGEDVALSEAKLVIYLPAGFNFVDALPEPETKGLSQEANVVPNVQGDSASRTWNLGRLEAGRTGAVVLKGILLGELETQRALRATLLYQPENFSSNFSTEKQVEVAIKKTLLEFKFVLPEKAGQDREFALSIQYKNLTTDDLENVRIIFNYPATFALLAAEPRATRESRVWELPVLKGGERGNIELAGKIKTDKPAEPFSVELGIVDQFKQFFSQEKIEKSIAILDPRLEMTATLNGQEEINLNPGDELNFLLTFDNVGQFTIENGTISVALPSEFLDLNVLEAGSGVYNQETKELTWSYSRVPDLAQITPGGRGKLECKTKVLAAFPFASLERRNQKFTLQPKFSSDNIEGLEGFDYTVEGNAPEAKINTDLSLVQEARYYTMQYEPAGSGPLPPKVGQRTTYRVYWTLANTSNDATDVEIIAVLPEGVEWMNNFVYPVGEGIGYNPQERKVVWKVGKIPAYTGTILPGIQAWFELGVTPTAAQVGQTLPLIVATLLEGRDGFTDAEIKREYPGADTNLENDLGALGKGAVVQ